MKKFFISLAISFLSFSVFSVSLKDFSLSVEPLFGMKWGQIDEYVFLKKSNFSNDKLSELNWELKPELYYGLKLNGVWQNFFAETSLSFGIPMKTGLMKDSDWFNAQTTSISGGVSSEKASGHDYKTCYSEHDNILDYDINFSLKGGYEFQLYQNIKAKPAFAFDYENIKFTGKNGKGLYGFGSDTDFYKTNGYYAAYNDKSNAAMAKFSGRVITYRREISLLWLGSDFSVNLPQNFTVFTGFFFSPYLRAISYDSHLTKGNDYADKTPAFFGAFKWTLGASYKINERQALLLNAGYLYMRVIRGDNYDKLASNSNYNKSTIADGGAGAKYFDLSLSYRFKIF